MTNGKRNFNLTTNLRYHRPAECLLDVFWRDDLDDAAVVIAVHGGSWMIGSKVVARKMAEPLVERGFCVITPGYRLSSYPDYLEFGVEGAILATLAALGLLSQHVFVVLVLLVFLVTVLAHTVAVGRRQRIRHPVHANDVSKCVEWAHEHAATFGGSSRKIFLLGHSAGGSLASFVGCGGTNLPPHVSIAGVVSVSGVLSGPRLLEPGIGRLVSRCAFPETDLHRCFPIHHVSPDAPPHLLLTAKRDYSLRRHARDFFFSLYEAGVYVKSHTYENNTHFTIVRNWRSTNKKVLEDIVAFFTQVVAYGDSISPRRNSRVKQ